MSERPSMAPEATPADLEHLKARLELFIKLKRKGVNPNHLFIDPQVIEFSVDLAQRHEGLDRTTVIEALCAALLKNFETISGEKPSDVRAEVFSRIYTAQVGLEMNRRLRLWSVAQGITGEVREAVGAAE